MHKIFKTVLNIIFALSVMFVILLTGIIFWDEIKFQYNKIFWEPELPFHELSPDMTRSDVYFIKGEPDACSDDKGMCFWQLSEYDIEDKLFVSFQNDEVSIIIKPFKPFGYSPPFNTVEELKAILGEENMLSISKDYITRRYTFLEWDITFDFKANNLDSVTIGDVKWRSTGDISQYIVNGKIICPGENCPWDDEGNIKPEYEGKNYKDFL